MAACGMLSRQDHRVKLKPMVVGVLTARRSSAMYINFDIVGDIYGQMVACRLQTTRIRNELSGARICFIIYDAHTGQLPLLDRIESLFFLSNLTFHSVRMYCNIYDLNVGQTFIQNGI
ncbi:unnamed protein product [Urochloa humidicola]